MVLVGGFALGGAIELQDGVDADFPDSLGDCGVVGADGELALVFVAAEFAPLTSQNQVPWNLLPRTTRRPASILRPSGLII